MGGIFFRGGFEERGWGRFSLSMLESRYSAQATPVEGSIAFAEKLSDIRFPNLSTASPLGSPTFSRKQAHLAVGPVWPVRKHDSDGTLANRLNGHLGRFPPASTMHRCTYIVL